MRLAAAVLFLAVACVLPAAPSVAQVPPAETPEQHDARMKWWREAKFGLFIHWGVYSVPAGFYKGKPIGGIGEWIMRSAQIPLADYRAFARQFNPVKYRPDAWAALAETAGMRYIVITSKHHDGFAMFDSQVTDWTLVRAAPYGKDAIAPLAAAARKRGLKFGLYYSQSQDWTHPGGAKAGLPEDGGWDEGHKGSYDDYLRRIAVPQVREILTNYQPDILWWDTPMHQSKERADLFRPLLSLRPGLITNNRLGGGYPGDTDTPEQFIPATGIPGRDWEVCMTMNDTWGYKSDDHNWKSSQDLIRKLVDIVSKGGNFLLNVGPTAEGEIPAESIDRLRAVGRWMKTNGEAIYGTVASPFSRLPWGRCTTKRRGEAATLYLHVFDWPSNGRLLVEGLRSPITSARLLAGGGPLTVESSPEGPILRLPAAAPDTDASVIRVEVSGRLSVVKVLPKQRPDGTVMLAAADADLHNVLGSDLQTETRDGVVNIGFWTDSRATVSWKFAVTRPGVFDVVAELASMGVSRFELEVPGQKLPCEAPNTGDYRRFQKVKLGRITLTKAGEVELRIKPTAGQWQPINIRSLLLNPETTSN